MKHLARKLVVDPIWAIQTIAGNRVSEIGQVYTNLVCPARFYLDLKECLLIESFSGTPVAYGIPAMIMENGHLFPVHRMPTNGSRYSPLIVKHTTVYECKITFSDLAVLEGLNKTPM